MFVKNSTLRLRLLVLAHYSGVISGQPVSKFADVEHTLIDVAAPPLLLGSWVLAATPIRSYQILF